MIQLESSASKIETRTRVIVMEIFGPILWECKNPAIICFSLSSESASVKHDRKAQATLFSLERENVSRFPSLLLSLPLSRPLTRTKGTILVKAVAHYQWLNNERCFVAATLLEENCNFFSVPWNLPSADPRALYHCPGQTDKRDTSDGFSGFISDKKTKTRRVSVHVGARTSRSYNSIMLGDTRAR